MSEAGDEPARAQGLFAAAFVRDGALQRDDLLAQGVAAFHRLYPGALDAPLDDFAVAAFYANEKKGTPASSCRCVSCSKVGWLAFTLLM